MVQFVCCLLFCKIDPKVGWIFTKFQPQVDHGTSWISLKFESDSDLVFIDLEVGFEMQKSPGK